MTMPDLWTLASNSTIDLLGWTLLHVVWQGALLAALLAGVLRLLRTHTPRVRYAVSCVALLGLLVLPVGTALFLSSSSGAAGAGETASTVAVVPAEVPVLSERPAPDPTAATALSWREQIAAWLRPVLPGLVLGWGVGVIAFAIRLAGGAWRVRRLRRTSTAAPEKWQRRLRALTERMGLRRSVALRRSARVESPVVAGWWRPVVLVPVGLLSGLPPNQVEALLLHELAHVRRHDVLVGRLQAVVETLLFFHPATWWISGQVRQTREACCDDRAVRAGTDRTVYIRALAALAERVMKGRPDAWTPAASDGSLLARIRRLLSPEAAPSSHVQRLSMVAAGLLLLGVPLGLAACASHQSATDADSSQVATAVPTPNEPAAGAGPAAPDAPPPDTGRRKIIVLRDDSTRRTIRVESDGPVQVDSLGDDAYVLRYDGRVDTLDLPDLPDVPDLSPLDDLERDLAFDADSLERELHRRFNPDSLERVLRARINPDSIERVIRMRIDRDSLEEEVVEMRLRADSLVRWHREHADSLHRHFEQMRERWEHSDRVLPGGRMEREMPDRLREQARRLRDQAERLEKRARDLEPSPSPEVPVDTSGRSDASVREIGPSDRGTRYDVTTESGRRDTMVVRPSGQILDQDDPSPAGTATATKQTGAQDETTSPWAPLLRRARTGDTYRVRARALEVLADSRYARWESTQRLFRERALDTTATDLERWKALTGLVRDGGPAAVRAMRAVENHAENPELRNLAGMSLDNVSKR
jgi:beta-lactamase regulating signal transducer with metallopeptidase domain